MSCQVKCDSLHFTHQLGHTLSLSFPAFPPLGSGQRSVSSLTLYLSLRSHFPPFVPVSFVSLPAHLLPDTCPASLPLMGFVLWWSLPFLNTEQGACSHRCRFDEAQFVHIKGSSCTGGWDLAAEIQSFICKRNLFPSRLIPNHDYWALSRRSPDGRQTLAPRGGLNLQFSPCVCIWALNN